MRRISPEEHSEIVRIVSEEIELYKKDEIPTLTSDVQLARKYGITPKAIKYHLKDILEEDREYRANELQTKPGGKHKLSKEKREEIVNRILEEIILHRSGKIAAITSAEKFAEEYSVTRQTINNYLKNIPENDKSYRTYVLQNDARTKISEEKHKELVDKVNEEIRLHREGKISTLTSTKRLAKEYHVSIMCIGRHIEDIPEEDKKYRASILKSQANKTKTILDSDLSKARESLGLTQKEVSALMGISIRYYSGIELGEEFPEEKIQRKIIEFYAGIIQNDVEESVPTSVIDTLIFEKETPEDSYDKQELKDRILAVLENLSPRERKILEMRYGIGEERDHTLEEVAEDFKLGRERIRQIEKKALRKLCHPNKSKLLRPFFEV